MNKRNMFVSCCMFFLLTANSAVNAITISYEAQDLTDTTVGEDLWQYTYNVSDYVFEADTGFSIYFDYNLYSNIQDPAPFVNADWDILILQPDLALPDNGVYDAYALVKGASLADQFTINFVWLGGNIPQSQFFEIYDSSFNITDSGFTNSAVASVPEPSSILLMGLGLLGIIPPVTKKLLQVHKNSLTSLV